MPYIFQTLSRKTGKPHPLWRFQYIDYLGRQRKATGTTSRKETEKIALQVQGKHFAIRNGVAAAPKASDVAQNIDQVVAEYMLWGNTVGGRRGRPWGPEHARKRTQNMAFWKAELGLRTQHDLIDCQARVERIIHRIHIESGRTGKTAWNRVETLAAFCRWLVDRDYLADDPLRRLKKINTQPVRRRRPLMPEEIVLLLEHCLPERRLLYETALCTGLRANELLHVTPVLLDVFRCGIRLEAPWTKNRLDGFQPTPRWLMDKLIAAAKGLGPTQPIFSIQKAHAARMIRDDLERAGVPIFKAGEGTVDFHALRTTYLTLLDMNGASAKEAQDLARHSTPIVTLNSYIRSTDERRRRVVDAIGGILQTPDRTHPEPTEVSPVIDETHKALESSAL